MESNKRIRGRGAQLKGDNKFEAFSEEELDSFLEYCRQEGEEPRNNQTQYTRVFPKSFINKVSSPDVGMEFSANPYQGCEHGCVYCYARNSHEYWGYTAGLDFETRILVKENAPQLLERELRRKSWKAAPVVLSGNTDCYQPAEKHYKITRACLKVFLKYRHPVGIITKNALILRDLDLLKQLNEQGLVGVHISVTTLSENTRRLLEPRTASIAKRLKTIKVLSSAGIPVNAMLAPIIPGINSHELMALAKTVSEQGAQSFGFTVVRLNGAIGQIFTDWIQKAMPLKAEKVLGQIRACHGGSLNDSRFGVRNKGEGELASQIRQLATVARKRYFSDRRFPSLNCGLFEEYRSGQYKLFN
ncbi:PA0069 family radical SAM protein [Robiginitalea sp. IMCC43444]|uniref:PA0069 family radical SAM protein n=1 Tax=Robiginitalea sp. IMCC43444 TaxID=3459121 RepID=UPI004041E51E